MRCCPLVTDKSLKREESFAPIMGYEKGEPVEELERIDPGFKPISDISPQSSFFSESFDVTPRLSRPAENKWPPIERELLKRTVGTADRFRLGTGRSTSREQKRDSNGTKDPP